MGFCYWVPGMELKAKKYGLEVPTMPKVELVLLRQVQAI
jgi:hypothetical protein